VRDFAANEEFLGIGVECDGTLIGQNIEALLVKYAHRLGFCRSHSDGSIPGASTTFSQQLRTVDFCALLICRPFAVKLLVQEPDGPLCLSLSQVHVPERGGEILVASKLLDAERGRTPHRQVAAERVTEDVQRARCP
jgi:hypothetical protein